MPFESVTFSFKQEMFDKCYTRIQKRIAAAKKKAKANKDLKGLSKKSAGNESFVSKDLGKTMALKKDKKASGKDSSSNVGSGPTTPVVRTPNAGGAAPD